MERTEGKTEKEGETYKMEPQGSSKGSIAFRKFTFNAGNGPSSILLVSLLKAIKVFKQIDTIYLG